MQEMNFTKGLISVQVKYSKWNIQRYENFFFYHDQLKFNKPSVYTCVCVCVCVCICFTHTVNAFSCSWCGQMTLKKRYAARKDAVFSHGCCVVLYAMLTCSVVSDSLQPHGVHQASPSKGVLQARILEWVAMPSARGSSWPMGQTQVSRIAGVFFTSWATREAPINKECPLIIAIMNTVGIQEEFINFYIDQGKIYLVFKSLRPW